MQIDQGPSSSMWKEGLEVLQIMLHTILEVHERPTNVMLQLCQLAYKVGCGILLKLIIAMGPIHHSRSFLKRVNTGTVLLRLNILVFGSLSCHEMCGKVRKHGMTNASNLLICFWYRVHPSTTYRRVLSLQTLNISILALISALLWQRTKNCSSFSNSEVNLAIKTVETRYLKLVTFYSMMINLVGYWSILDNTTVN